MLRVILKAGWFMAIAMLIGAMALPLYAADCKDPSPTLLAGKDLLDPVDYRDLTPSELSMVRQIMRSLEGSWTGQGFTIRCPSVDGIVDKEEFKYKIEGKVQIDFYGNLLLEMEFIDTQNRSSHQELFRLYLKEMRLKYSDETYGDVELVTLAPNQITFIRRLTLRGRYSSGIYARKEYVISVLMDASGFSIHRDSYAGGKMRSKRRLRFEGK